MKQNANLYDCVYRDIVTDIYIGKLKKGDELPALSELCKQYSVGRNTARAAFQLLADNCYIHPVVGKRAKIIFDFNNPETRSLYITELAQRKDAIADVFYALALFMPDIAVFCLSTCETGKRNEIASIARYTATHLNAKSELELSMALFEIYQSALSLPGNQLLLSLFKAMFQFIQAPLTASERKGYTFQLMIPIIRIFMKSFERFILYEKYHSLKKQLVAFCQTVGRASSVRFEKLCASLSDSVQVEFTWIAQRKQEYLYSALIMDLLKKINQGVYQPGDPLPSYTKLAKQYDVSEKTTRKAISILNELQIVHTANGKHTKVLPRSHKNLQLFLNTPHLRQDMIVFFEVLQILVIIANASINAALPYIRQDQIEEFIQNLPKSSLVSFEMMMDLLYFSIPSPAVQNIYRHLKKVFYFSYYLQYFLGGRAPELRNLFLDTVVYMKTGDSKLAAETYYSAVSSIFIRIKSYLASQGIFIPYSVVPAANTKKV